MIVYGIMFLMSMFFMHLATRTTNQKKKILFYILSCLPFVLVSGFRYGVGTDYFRRYTPDYVRMYRGARIGNLEIGFTLLMKATMLVSAKPFLLFFITSLLLNGFVFFAIVKESDDKVLSICIFFLLGFFFDSLNIMRQYLASAFIFVGLLYLIKGKKWAYILSVLVAATFHSSALVMLLLAVFDYRVLLSYKVFLPLLVVVLALNTRLLTVVEFCLKNTRFNVYLRGKLFKGEVSYLFILENLFFYLLMTYCYNNGYIRGRKAALYINTQAMALLCMCLGSCHMLFIRIAFYYSVIQVVAVPYFLSRFRKTYALTLRHRIVRLDIIKTLIVCCMLVAFYRTNILNNVNEVLPYRTIFTKKWLIY